MKKFFGIFILTVMSIFIFACSDSSAGFSAGDVCPESGRGTFIDERDGQVYKYTTIGDQIWMAENLKYNAEYSVCYDSLNGFCDTYGRFYSLQKNGDGLAELDENLVASVCPAGWHVPSLAEWDILVNEIGDGYNQKSANRLRNDSISSSYRTGNDECGFSALLGGAYIGKNHIEFYKFDALFWTSTPMSDGMIYSVKIEQDITPFNSLYRMSLRCVKD